MPNNVRHTMRIYGAEEALTAFETAHVREDCLSFETVTPRPAALDIESGSTTADGAEVLAGNWKALTARGWTWVIAEGLDSQAKWEAHLDKRDPDWHIVAQARLDNIAKYGVPTWYEWNRREWGTKWDAYDGTAKREGPALILRFDTAWSSPTPIFEKLAKMYPALKFEISCFDDCHNYAMDGWYNAEPAYRDVPVTDAAYERAYSEPPPAQED